MKEFRIVENRWHYWLQNEVFDYVRKPHRKPKSVCLYVWKTVLSAPLFVGMLMVVIPFVVAFGIGSYIVAPLFGYYPTRLSWFAFPATETSAGPEMKEDAVLAPRRPLFWNIYGYHILIALVVLWNMAPIAGALLDLGSQAGSEALSLTTTYWFVPLFLAIGILCLALLLKFRKSETWDLTKLYLKARKEKWCPNVVYLSAPDAEEKQ
jgi:hypothetical protein